MSLLGLLDYDDSSSSSSDSDENQEKDVCSSTTQSSVSQDTHKNSETLSLPSPILDVNSTACSSRTYQQSSVFYNPFKAEEKKKLDVLEKHVQLSNTAPFQMKNNKRVCYKFQKGKCRYGDKCRFAHSTDKFTTKTGLTNNKKFTDDSDTIEGISHINQQQTSYDEAVNEDDSNINSNRKKRRVGVSDSLIPPKRAMKAFEKQKQNSGKF